MSDKYELLRESLHELQRESSARGGNNPRSQMILDLLADHEALQAECEKLRNLLRHAQPIITAHAKASHMLEGFRPKRNQWDELVEAVNAAIHEDSQ